MQFNLQVNFDAEDKRFYISINANFNTLWKELERCLPECAERTIVFRRLEEALMYVNKAIAKSDKYKAEKNAEKNP